MEPLNQEAAMRKPRVMIFDDDPMFLELLHIFFSKSGYEIFSYGAPVVCPLDENAIDGRECLAPCADLVMSDFQMRKMTGLELFQRQARRGCLIDKKMKAIISGYSGGELAAQCEESGCKFFNKPFSRKELSVWLNERQQYFDLSRQLGGKKINKRYSFKQYIEYQLNTFDPDKKYTGFTLNKSIDGLGLKVSNPLYAGQKITIIINGLEISPLNGTVVWCSKVGENAYRAGLRLCNN
jgi:CheY-like chemotaxis protein